MLGAGAFLNDQRLHRSTLQIYVEYVDSAVAPLAYPQASLRDPRELNIRPEELSTHANPGPRQQAYYTNLHGTFP